MVGSVTQWPWRGSGRATHHLWGSDQTIEQCLEFSLQCTSFLGETWVWVCLQPRHVLCPNLQRISLQMLCLEPLTSISTLSKTTCCSPYFFDLAPASNQSWVWGKSTGSKLPAGRGYYRESCKSFEKSFEQTCYSKDSTAPFDDFMASVEGCRVAAMKESARSCVCRGCLGRVYMHMGWPIIPHSQHCQRCDFG